MRMSNMTETTYELFLSAYVTIYTVGVLDAVDASKSSTLSGARTSTQAQQPCTVELDTSS